nr:retrovirus-related Pol polyprotein from transposon TNT 1-94 [Tanacetum cinerariifolium]
PDDYKNYFECEIYRSYDHSTLGHSRVIQIKGRVLAESFLSNESSFGVKCNICGSTVHSTSDHNEFDHFKRGEKIQVAKAKEPTKNQDSLLYSKQINLVKRHDKTPYEILKERIPNINYFHMFGCPVFIHNHEDYLGKFDVKADDGYFLGYSFVLKAFRVYNTRRQQIEETYHVTFDESMETIKFTNTSLDEIGIDDSFRYPPDEFLHKELMIPSLSHLNGYYCEEKKGSYGP